MNNHQSTMETKSNSLQFPFEKKRKYQDEMIETVAGALEKKNHCLITAPTGIGKTAGVLYPTLNFALKNTNQNHKIFFLTSKTTQQKLALETAKKILETNSKGSVIVLQAKEKICLNQEYICNERYCQYLKNYMKEDTSDVLNILAKKRIIKPADISLLSKQAIICPFEVSLDLSERVNIIICDYNYVFHPIFYIQRYFNEDFSKFICLIDEAHNLYNRGIDYYSPSITKQEIRNLKKIFKPKKGEKNLFYDFFDEIHKYFNKIARKKTKEEKFIVEIDQKLMKQWYKTLDKKLLPRYFLKHGKHLSRNQDALIKFHQDFKYFNKVLRLLSERYVHYYNKKEHRLNILCLNPNKELGKRIKGFQSTIAFSATLTPISFFRTVLGFPSQSIDISLASPFPKKNRKILVLPQISTKYNEREKDAKNVCQIITNVIKTKKGNWAVFFSSFNYLERIYSELQLSDNINVIVQKRRMTEKARSKILEKLEKNEYTVLLGVQGGIFSEGVDYIDKMLIGALVIGPGLPLYSFETELARKYFEEEYSKGFEYAYRNPGMIRVIQAAGRVIRTQDDIGVIILIGKRFALSYYNEVFPRDWYENFPRELINHGYYQSVLQNFWMSHE
ncbi:MAG: ATP-dependent DNA helicase [Candidatus Hodarchaeales archaeon]|jgi:DNA excision repair protein ERCC-2